MDSEMFYQRLKQKLLFLKFYLLNSDFRLLVRSGIFDDYYYNLKNRDVAELGLDGRLHYFRGGWREGIRGRDPHPLFEICYYLGGSPESADGKSEPLLAFIKEGWREGRKPNAYFETAYYLHENRDIHFNELNTPLAHYIRTGWKEGRQPRPYFDPLYYLHAYADVSKSGLDPLAHYIQIGRKQRRRPSLFFDVEWYLDKTPNLSEFAEDILLHYDHYGIREAKSPIPVFDPVFYRAQTGAAVGVDDDPLAHYLKVGEVEGVKPCSWFDPVYYRSANALEPEVSPLGHYLQRGVYAGALPNKDVAALDRQPMISVVVPVYNPRIHYLNNCIRSVLYQSYPHWQLCLADDCSTEPHVRPLLQEWAERDQRIKLIFLETNQGIAEATNAAATLADGEYLGFLDNDDELTSECLFRIAETINDTGADLLYSDEDLIGEDGRRFSVFHKPDFNPELLLCHNYVTHFVVTARRLWKQIGGLEKEKSGAQDYDLFLKLTESAQKIVHVPEVLYHWRASETSTSINHNQKEYAHEAGRQSVEDALRRRDIEAEVLDTDFKFFYRVKRELYILPLVSLVVSGDRTDADCVEWLERLLQITEYAHFEVIILRRKEENRPALIACAAASDRPMKIIETDGKAGCAVLWNQALPHCDGEYVVLLSDALEPADGYWLSALMEYCQRPDTGIVAGSVEMEPVAGVEVTPLPDISNQSPLYYARFVQQASILLNGLHCPQNIWCLPGICCAINRELLDAGGGIDSENFPDLFALHDLSFSCIEKGLYIYFTPYCRLHQMVGKDVNLAGEIESWQHEKYVFQQKWRKKLQQGDPFYNLGKLQEAGVSREDFLGWFSGA